jgi:malonyl-CoA O-methyltransferase
MAVNTIDKLFVKKTFNRHAPTYDEYAGLQAALGERLLRHVNGSLPAFPRILDIGMGTGGTTLRLLERFPAASIHGCDLALNMVACSRAKEALQSRRQLFITADAEFLPYRDTCFDLVISSFTLQWLEQWGRALQEIYRVLKPGGSFLCSLFGGETFNELRASFIRACAEAGYIPGEPLRLLGSEEHCADALQSAGFLETFTAMDLLTQHYRTVEDLIRCIKGMGAQNASRGRSRGLGVRRIWNRMIALYEADFRQRDGIPATYHVIMGGGKKPDAVAPRQHRAAQLK